MTTSTLNHTQGICGYKYQKTERTADTEIYYLHSTAKQLACPQCRSRETSIVATGRTRDIRCLCIGLKNADAHRRPAHSMPGMRRGEP